MLHSMVGMAVHGRELTSQEPTPAFAPVGSFVRQSYEVDCARFLADLKHRVAPTEVPDSRSLETSR